MDISAIDKNFTLSSIDEPDIEWFDALSKPFSLHGLLYDETARIYEEEPGLFLRLPREISKEISYGVNWLNPMTAGGRLRFVTDSPYVAIKCTAPAYDPMTHMPLSGSHGFSIYVNGRFDGKYTPSFKNLQNAKDFIYAFEGIRRFTDTTDSSKLCELYFPLYGGVRRLYIGIKKGSVLNAPPAYSVQQPVVFYGSSVTQGACALRPGNDYTAILSRWLHCDYINLGFSGNGFGEKQLIDYMTGISASAYVFDYNYYQGQEHRMAQSHFEIYEQIRSARKDTPILLLDKPAFEYDPIADKRRAMIRETYERAKENGDKNVYFIDAETLFGEELGRDGCHPTELGFYRMAKTVYPVLKTMLNK